MESVIFDYDALASQYARHRRIHPEVFQELLETSVVVTESTVLEVGCGTGNYITDLHKKAGCRCWGVDPSDEMLAIAHEKSAEISFKPGRAEKLDFPDAFFSFIFSVDVIHHLQRHRSYIQEAYRTLKPGGRLCTVTESAELLRTRVPLASYFPETVEKALIRYPRISKLKALMRSAGFQEQNEKKVVFPYEIYDIQVYEEKAFSSLHLIPEDAFKRGISRMHADLETGPIQAVSHYLLLWGKKDGSE